MCEFDVSLTNATQAQGYVNSSTSCNISSHLTYSTWFLNVNTLFFFLFFTLTAFPLFVLVSILQLFYTFTALFNLYISKTCERMASLLMVCCWLLLVAIYFLCPGRLKNKINLDCDINTTLWIPSSARNCLEKTSGMTSLITYIRLCNSAHFALTVADVQDFWAEINWI